MNYDVIVIGFGKAGKTLAAKFAKANKKVALIEQDVKMYGGTCINIGCIPTKTLLVQAEKDGDFKLAMQEKEAVTTRLRNKNFTNLDAVVDVYNAKAKFVSNKEVEISSAAETKKLTADLIIINTGATSIIPKIKGIYSAKHVYDSTQIQQLDTLPKSLAIIGGGNIGLEFATLYAKLGSAVTIFESNSDIMTREEPIVQSLAKEYLEQQGIKIETNAVIKELKDNASSVEVVTEDSTFTFDAVLFATGRKPNIETLGLENTSIQLTERQGIQTNQFLETSVKGVFAVGDVTGGLQFTYVSFDHARIVWDYVMSDGNYTLNSQRVIPTSLFINPPLSKVGLTEAEAIKEGYQIKTNEQLVATMPRAHVNNDLRGVFKVIVNQENNQILGASLYGKESPELINLIVLAMSHQLPYTVFQQQIFTHPTMAENFNDLFNF